MSADASEPPSHLRPFPLDAPEAPRERHGNVDLYLPAAEAPRPAALFVHGGPVLADARPIPRDRPTLMGYAHRAAAGGAVAAVVDVPHGRHAFETVDPTDESRDAIRRAMRAVLGRLGVPNTGSPVEA